MSFKKKRLGSYTVYHILYTEQLNVSGQANPTIFF